MSVILITGGFSNNPVDGGTGTAEIYNPATDTSCLLPNAEFPGGSYHSQNEGLVCGGLEGNDMFSTCSVFHPPSGKWIPFADLLQKRFAHASWATGEEVYLIGGFGDQSNQNKKTSERVKMDGSVKEGFSLKYDTW